MNAHYACRVNNYLNSNHTMYLAQQFSAADFLAFFLGNFCRKLANLVVPPTDGTMKRLLRCKAHPVI